MSYLLCGVKRKRKNGQHWIDCDGNQLKEGFPGRNVVPAGLIWVCGMQRQASSCLIQTKTGTSVESSAAVTSWQKEEENNDTAIWFYEMKWTLWDRVPVSGMNGQEWYTGNNGNDDARVFSEFWNEINEINIFVLTLPHHPKHPRPIITGERKSVSNRTSRWEFDPSLISRVLNLYVRFQNATAFRQNWKWAKTLTFNKKSFC